MKVLRRTKSVCPKCLEKIGSQVIEKGNQVFLSKYCEKHGEFNTLLSNDKEYYKDLHETYFKLNNTGRGKKQTDYLFFLTYRCNLDCTFCLSNANHTDYRDPTLENIKNMTKGLKNVRINITGGDPTVYHNLARVIEIIRESGNTPTLFTNGIKIANLSYLEKLKKAGLDEIHLQFDSMNDEIYTKMRGRKMLDIKLTALSNLKKLKIPTLLKMTVAKGINEKEVKKVFEYGVGQDFIKGIFFYGYRLLGNIGFDQSKSMMPEEIIDILVKQKKGVISKKDILNFQKLFYLFSNLFSSPKCFYNQSMILYSDGEKITPITRMLNCEVINKEISAYIKNEGKKIKRLKSVIKIIITSSISFLKSKHLFSLFPIYLKYGLGGFSKLPSKFKLLGFGTICDPYNIDYEIVKNCNQGEISTTSGISREIAVGNILREKVIKSTNINLNYS